MPVIGLYLVGYFFPFVVGRHLNHCNLCMVLCCLRCQKFLSSQSSFSCLSDWSIVCKITEERLHSINKVPPTKIWVCSRSSNDTYSVQTLPVLLGSFDRYVPTILSGNKIDGHLIRHFLPYLVGWGFFYMYYWLYGCIFLLPVRFTLALKLEL